MRNKSKYYVLLLISLLMIFFGTFLFFVATSKLSDEVAEVSKGGGFGGLKEKFPKINLKTPDPNCAPPNACTTSTAYPQNSEVNSSANKTRKAEPTRIGAINSIFPKNVYLGSSKTVTLRLKTDDLEEKAFIQLSEVKSTEAVKKDELEITDKDINTNQIKEFEVTLKSSSFEITPSEPQTGEFKVGDSLFWKWIITPKKDVKNEQDLIVSVDIKYKKSGADNSLEQSTQNVNAKTESVETYKKRIYSETVSINVTENWIDWSYTKFTGLFIFIVGAGLNFPLALNWYKERKAKKETTPRVRGVAERIKIEREEAEKKANKTD